jgi:hypothetical protein
LNSENDRLLTRLDEIQKDLPEQPNSLTEAERKAALPVFDESERILREVKGNIRRVRELGTASEGAQKVADARAETLLGIIWWSDVSKVIGIICILLGFTFW